MDGRTMDASEDTTFEMSQVERKLASLLIVEPDLGERHRMRSALLSAGYGSICDAPSHIQALERLEERTISHVIFDARKTNMPSKEFIQKALEMVPEIIAIPTSGEPDVEDVFEFLILGARGYVVKPFTADTLDQAIVLATKGDPLSADVRGSTGRNQVLSVILLNSLDRLAILLRQARQFETAKREVPRAIAVFRRAAEFARIYAKDGQEGLLETLEEMCLDRGGGAASRLGRLRERLKSTRRVGEDEDGM